MMEYPEPQYAVLTYSGEDIQNKEVFGLKYDALTYIGGLKDIDYVLVGWMEIKKGSKLIWIIQDNLTQKFEDSELLQNINSFLFSFDSDWISEWT
jgi:hypothetical protein|tara:strand:+ start:638 stop:922 length:285 start_codon:yes stop_codon:yes gene_type:complete